MKYDELEIGSVYVHKVSGAYAVVVELDAPAVRVRMLKNDGSGAEDYTAYTFIPAELETIENHLRRQLKEMEFKQDLMESAKKRRDQKELENLATPSTVN